METVYLIQEQVERGPREFAHAYEPTFVTRAVCTSEDEAAKLREEIADEGNALILLKVPFNEVFPRNLSAAATQETQLCRSSKSSDATPDHRTPVTTTNHLQVDPATYERDRKIREAEMMTRWNIHPSEYRHGE